MLRNRRGYKRVTSDFFSDLSAGHGPESKSEEKYDVTPRRLPHLRPHPRCHCSSFFTCCSWVAFRLAFSCFCSEHSDFWRKPRVHVQMCMLLCFVLCPGAICLVRFGSSCQFVPCLMDVPEARYRSVGQQILYLWCICIWAMITV